MKKWAVTAFFILAISAANLAGAVSPDDLGISNPGVLPGNPFYFVKEWKRDLRRALTFSEIEKARVNLEILNERAAEISKLAEIALPSPALKEAVSRYENDLVNIGNVPNELRRQFIAQSLKHIQLFNEVPYSQGVRQYFAKFSFDPNLVRELNLQDLNTDHSVYNSLLKAEAINVIDDYRLARAKEDLLLDFLAEFLAKKEERENKVNKVNKVNEIAKLKGNLIDRLQVLDELRLIIANSELKSVVSLIRQQVLNNIDIQEENLSALIDQVGKLIDKAPPGEMKEQSLFYYQQAIKFYQEKQWLAALGQASLASASARRAIFISQWSDYKKEVAILKLQYDQLNTTDQDLEERIVRLSDLINSRNISHIDLAIEDLLISIKLQIAQLRYQ